MYFIEMGNLYCWGFRRFLFVLFLNIVDVFFLSFLLNYYFYSDMLITWCRNMFFIFDIVLKFIRKKLFKF